MAQHSSVATIAKRLRDGQTTAVDLAEAAIEAYGASESRLNAYKTWAGDAILAQARAVDALLRSGIDTGPLMGLPLSVKDLYGVRNLPTFAGTCSELPQDWQRPGPIVQGITRQLGIVTGKTHTVEFAFGGLGTNHHWGAPRNPWSSSVAKVPGGSSSGAGVSLVQQSALLAIGTDTAGSVRIPAAMTGQTALKPTKGRWPVQGIVPLSTSLDTPGIITRSAADLAYFFAAIEGRTEPGPRPLNGLRIGLVRPLFDDGADASILEVTDRALARLESHGAKLIDVDLPAAPVALGIFRQGGLAGPELLAFLLQNFPERIEMLDPMVGQRVKHETNTTATEYLARAATLAACRETSLLAFADCDIIASPTVAISPPALSDLREPDAYRRANMMALRNTAVVNLLGWCAVTVPSGLDSEGMPVGLQLMATPLCEAELISAALSVENLLGNGAELLGQPPRF